MTLTNHHPRTARFAIILVILLFLPSQITVFGKKRNNSNSRRKVTRVEKHKKASARSRKTSARERRRGRRNDRLSARNSRRGGRVRLSRREARREARRQRQLTARETSASLKALQRRLGRPLTRRERAAEMRRIGSRRRQEILEARRRAEAARQAAIARQRAIDEALRNEVQGMIARDNIVGEDAEVRRVAVNALGHHAGTVVVMDPMTGKVYSVVNQEWALRRGFKPCSTIKLVTGVAGLSENIISPAEFALASDRPRMDLTTALARSNNPYFERVGGTLGFDKMVSYARELGLGQKTGLNVPFEYPGRLPELTPNFTVRRMFSYADGFEVTPLQLGNLVSAMANGGKLMVPQVPRTPEETARFKPKVNRTLNIDGTVLQRMVPGMVGAVNYGSGRKAYDPTQTVAGKTGTCNGGESWVGLFTSYAPLANPKLAVVVITRGTDARRHLPAAVAGQIYRNLSHRFGTPANLQIATTPDDEERDAEAEEGDELIGADTSTDSNTDVSDSTTTATGPVTTPPLGTPAPRNTVRRVLMPIDRRPAEVKSGDAQKTVQPAKSPAKPPAQPDDRPRLTHPTEP